VENTQLGPTVERLPPASEASVANVTSGTVAIAPTEDQRDAAMREMHQYNDLLGGLIVAKGPHAGEYKCHHCRVNHKALPKETQETDPDVCVYGCSREKAVMEKYLVEKRILGFVVPDDMDSTVLYRSITKEEWSRLDHILGALFGYKTDWLLDPAIMKAGLLEAYNKL
jgi:hypothetical protein